MAPEYVIDLDNQGPTVTTVSIELNPVIGGDVPCILEDINGNPVLGASAVTCSSIQTVPFSSFNWFNFNESTLRATISIDLVDAANDGANLGRWFFKLEVSYIDGQGNT